MLLRALLAAWMLATFTPVISGQIRLWDNLYEDPVLNSEAVAVANAPAGHTWVLCRMRNPAAGSHYRLLLLNSAGVYVRHVDVSGLPTSAGYPWDLPADLVCDEQGNAYVLGGSVTARGNGGMFLFSCGMDGVINWSTYGPHDYDPSDYSGVELILTSGNVLVALGNVKETSGYISALTVDSFNLSGTLLWSSTWGGLSYGTGVAADQAGNVYAAGNQYRQGMGWDAALVKFAPDGQRKWVFLYDGALREDEARDVELSESGGPVVVGHTTRASSVYPLAFAVSPSGNLLWERLSGAGSSGYNNEFGRLQARSSGGWRLVGSTSETGTKQILLEDLDANGFLMQRSMTSLTHGNFRYMYLNGLATDSYGCSIAVGDISDDTNKRGFICQFNPDGFVSGFRVFERGNGKSNRVRAVCQQDDGPAVIAGYRNRDDGSSSDFAWVMSYAPEGIAQVIGGGCPGSHGVPAISWSGPPSLQSGTIEIAVSHARPHAPAALLIASQAAGRRLTSDCEVLIPLKDARPMGITSTNALGRARLTYSLPSRLAFAGMTIHAQWLIVDPAGTPYHSQTISASEVADFRLGF